MYLYGDSGLVYRGLLLRSGAAYGLLGLLGLPGLPAQSAWILEAVHHSVTGAARIPTRPT